MKIEILGPGCQKCKAAEKNVREAVAEAGIDSAIEKVTDLKEIAKHGVFITPAVVVDGKVKCVGKVPSKEEVLGWING
ncbi:MAG TPA: thioredoxin family protein [Desulfobacterales bacterium]|nr:thioredoxin family protein [Desulfobacterales bacterium]